jgi:transmembrane sensor
VSAAGHPCADHRAIEARAAAWIAERDRLQEHGGWTAEREAALQDWLAASTAHRVAYLRLHQAWQRADRLGACRPLPEAAARPAAGAWRPSRHAPAAAWAARAAGVAVLGLALAGLWSLTRDESASGAPAVAQAEQAHATAKGERATMSMADGSRLTLNTATRLRTALTASSRTVWLDEGEAHFEVARDARRPFVVQAGEQRVTVLGTRFSVRREGQRLRVSVLEGRVRVQPERNQRGAVLNGGDLALVEPDHVIVARRTARQLQDELAWLDGKLVFDQATLGEVAQEFNRYNRRPLVIDDEAVAGIRVGGAFDVHNVEGFARLLHTGFGLEVSVQAEQIRVAPARR